MEALNLRLSTIYNQLQATQLVSTKIVNDANLTEFRKVLNRAAPVTEMDTAMSDMARFLHRTARHNWSRCIVNSGLKHLVLLTDGFPIAMSFGLKDLITIRWNRQLKEFDVLAGVQQRPVVPRQEKPADEFQEVRRRNNRKPRKFVHSHHDGRTRRDDQSQQDDRDNHPSAPIASSKSEEIVTAVADELVSTITATHSAEPIALDDFSQSIRVSGKSWADIVDDEN